MDRRSIGSENSDKVGVAGKGNAKAKTWKATEEIGSRKDLIESETPKGSARRKAREGEYEGSVRSLRTQQRAKSQRQIC